ncbi:MAG: hypothetical protein D6704_06870 [Nitrospirae bacterium]|nr:MAG: hypothetical protein D6704_06870 [Nitrospirota bacterium]
MKTILYLLSKELTSFPEGIIPQTPLQDYSLTLLLIQKGVRNTVSFPFPCYALSDDLESQGIASSYPVVDYSTMLHMLLQADTVIVL